MLKFVHFPLFFILSFFVASAANANYSVNQKAYDALGASQAYALGFTGAGVTVAVVDDGARQTHQELKDKFSELQKEEYNVQDITEHGTSVSSLIAGKKDGTGMHGIAYDAKLLVLATELDDDVECSACYQNYLKAWYFLTGNEFDNVKIINNSIGSDKYFHDSFDYLNISLSVVEAVVGKDKLIVASAGNETTCAGMVVSGACRIFDGGIA